MRTESTLPGAWALAGTLMLLCAGIGPAVARDATPPVQVVATGWRVQGEATMRFFGMPVYDATLTVPATFSPETWTAQPLALSLRYHRSLSGTAIAERSLHEMRRAGAIDEARAVRWLDFLKEALPDVRAGDRIVGRWSPATGTVSLQHNDGPAREIADREFGTRFFGIWLAPHTSEPGLRARLLGLS